MNHTEENIINQNATIREALMLLNVIPHDHQTLFVIDDIRHMVGTLTDGDIRRGLIRGCFLDDNISNIMRRDFRFIREGDFSVGLLRNFRNEGIFFVPILNDCGTIISVCNLKKYKSVLPIDAILMAGGKGLRLRPLTEHIPKPLLPIGNKPIIDYNIDSLICYGVKNIFVTVNYLKEQIERYYDKPHKDVDVQCVREPEFFGTIGSTKLVKTFENDTILVMNSDLFTNIDFEDFYLQFKSNSADMAVASVPYGFTVPYGIFDTNGIYITGIREKPSYSYYANAGIYMFKKQVLDFVPMGTYFDATDLITELIRKKKKVIRFPITGYWIDIGKKDDYNKAQEFAKYM